MEPQTKLLLMIYLISSAYIIQYNYINEVDTQRFPNIFLSFIDMSIANHVDLRYFSLLPLLHGEISIDPSLSRIAQRVMVTESFFPNVVTLYLSLYYLTDLSPQVLIRLSFGAILLPLILLGMISVCIGKGRTKNTFYLLLGLYGILFLLTSKSTSSLYVATTGFALLFTAFICIKRFLESSHRDAYLILIVILTLSLAQYWHTALSILLFILIGIFLTLIILFIIPDMKWWEDKRKILIRAGILATLCLVIGAAFCHLWQSSYVKFSASISEFLSSLFIKLKGGSPFPVPYGFNYQTLTWGKIYFISNLLILSISTLVLVLALYLHIRKAWQLRQIKLPLVLTISILMAQMAYLFAYYNSKGISLIYISIWFPLLGVWLFIETNTSLGNQRVLRRIIIISLISICLLSLTCNMALRLTNEMGETSVTKYRDTESSFLWLYSRMGKNRVVITDFNILGKYLQREAQITKPTIEYEYLVPGIYAILLGEQRDTSEKLRGKYIAMDHATMSKDLPIHTIASRALLIPELNLIENHPNQNKIYEDGHITIFILIGGLAE